MTLAEEITERLQVLEPLQLELIDDSALHHGHKGNTGGGHFTLNIISSHFFGKSQIMRHRLIYAQVADLMTKQIHAISIQAYAPDEATLNH